MDDDKYRNAVVLKGHKEGISVSLNPDIPFYTLKGLFKEKVTATKHFFNGAKSNVVFIGRDLTEEQEEVLLDIIIAETTLEVLFAAQEGFFKQARILHESQAKGISDDDFVTNYHRGSLRSGQSINYKGSVVIAGDVNPGSHIVAEGNIIVLGALKGMVHAGCTGDEDCFISAISFRPTQIRIANFITIIPEDTRLSAPSMAYIKGEQLYIEPLMN